MANFDSHRLSGLTRGVRVFECATCGFDYFESDVVYRNGVLQCTVAGPKSKPCFDEIGYKERVNTRPVVRYIPTDGGRYRYPG